METKRTLNKRAVAAWIAAAVILSPGGPAEAGWRLEAHWSFNDESDIGRDDSGNGRQAVPSGDPTWVDLGGGNGALSFDGLNDYLTAFDGPDLTFNLDEYRIETRIRYTSPTYHPLLRRGRSGPSYHNNFRLDVDVEVKGQVCGGHDKADDAGEHVYTNSAHLLNDGAWHELVLSYEASSLKIYRDGTLDDSRTVPGPGYQSGSKWPITIGAAGEHNLPHDYYTGEIDYVKIYAIPEPATLSLLALGGLVALRRKRR